MSLATHLTSLFAVMLPSVGIASIPVVGYVLQVHGLLRFVYLSLSLSLSLSYFLSLLFLFQFHFLSLFQFLYLTHSHL